MNRNANTKFSKAAPDIDIKRSRFHIPHHQAKLPAQRWEREFRHS